MSLFYLLSKFVNFFLAPAHWIIILLVITFFIKKQHVKKRLQIAAFILFIVFSNQALFSVVANAWQPPKAALEDSAGFSAGILLGGLSQSDRNGNGFFNDASDRFIQTVQLYHRGIIKKVLITGATLGSDEPPEADYLLPELVNAGVRAEDVIVENRAMNTHQNAVFSKQKLLQLQLPPPYVVITSAFHVPRTKKVFEHANVEAIMYPSNYLAVDKTPALTDILIPQVKTLDTWRLLIKEFVGVLGYKLTNKA
ncbi:YdcF family protein [Aridibaculum aurantiacum]|uniref:YdcF family protein n=1 Tax=Aridibaculum aurantiacum TaxID=2810307 RepID=UPI001A97AC6E|nr:YdcF family protein [Aridibaculum aurantiacum]